MPTTPNSYVLTQTNRAAAAVCTAAKASRANLTDAVKILDAGVNGTLVKQVTAIARADLASALRGELYLYDGTTVYFFDADTVAAYTYGATTAPPVTKFDNNITDDQPLYLASGWSLYAAIGTALAGGVVFTALAEDY